MLAKNESQIDRAIRLIVGLVLLVVGSQIGGWLQIVLYLLAIVALVTAATGVCFIYKMFGWNTNKHEVAKPATVPAEPATMEAVEPAEEAPAEETEENKEVATAETEEEAELAVDEPTAEETPAPEVEETKEEEPVSADNSDEAKEEKVE